MNVSWLKKFILYFVIERATSKTITTSAVFSADNRQIVSRSRVHQIAYKKS